MLDRQVCTSISGQKAPTVPALQLRPGYSLKYGKSTFAPVSGTAYLCQPIGCEAAVTDSQHGKDQKN
jgi:hypothetical protein